MALSNQQLNEYLDRGFTIIDGFFSEDEVHIMQQELAALQEQGLLRNVSTDGDGETESNTEFNLQICPLSPKNETFRKLPFAAKVIEAMGQLSDEPMFHRLDQIFLKPARNGAGTGWHQDNAYFTEAQAEHSVAGIGMWIAVNDASLANGTMQLIPHKHHEVLEHVRDGGSDHHVTCAAVVDESTAIPAEVKAGGVIFFNYGVPHCTKANTTDGDRADWRCTFSKNRMLNCARALFTDR